MSQKPTFARIGVVSEGTLRDEDLISAFSAELDYYMKRLRLSRDQRKRFTLLVSDCTKYDDLTDSVCQIAFGGALIGRLEEALDEIAPPYCYFGTAEGDGACFGFFPSEDINNRDREGRTWDCQTQVLNAGDEIDREHWGEDVYLVNDHGNVSCGHVDRRGRFKAYWDCV